jgi:membrane-associated phospholipid phosphatase
MDYILTHAFVRRIARITALVSAVGVSALGLFVHVFPVLDSDIAISQRIQDLNPRVFEPFMASVSVFGAPSVAAVSILLSAATFFMLSYRREAGFMLFAFAGDGVNALVKIIVDRPRPSADMVTVMSQLADRSFPSGHVVHYVIFFGLLYVIISFRWALARWAKLLITFLFLGLIVGIAVSRVYLGVHWATDVLGGYMAGFAMLWTILHFYFHPHRAREISVAGDSISR